MDQSLHVEAGGGSNGRKLQRGLVTPQLDAARQIIRTKLEANKPISPHRLQDLYGISHVTFDMAITAELARKEAREELLAEPPPIDPATLPKTAQAKLAAAMRQQAKKLKQEFEARIAAEYLKRFEQRFPDMQKRHNEAYLAKATYEKYLQQQKKIFTADEFKSILMILHPDGERSPERRALAFVLFNAKKFAMTGEK